MRLEHFELFSIRRFRSHIGRNILKCVRYSRMERCQEGSNNLHFNELWKALSSLSIICPKKFLQQSWEHLFLIQQPEAESIWRFSTWWKIIQFTKYFSWWEMYSKLNYLRHKEQRSFDQKSFLKLLRDCKSWFECFKDDRGNCFCTRRPQTDVIIYCFKWRF